MTIWLEINPKHWSLDYLLKILSSMTIHQYWSLNLRRNQVWTCQSGSFKLGQGGVHQETQPEREGFQADHCKATLIF